MRDYDPTTGRYLQVDPLGLVDGASVYGYARQNPGRYVDPRGEQDGPHGSTKVPGTGYSVRIDPPAQPNQQRHAHVFDRKGCDLCVVNEDGTGSHKTDPKVLRNKKLWRFLTSKGFQRLSMYAPLWDLCQQLAQKQYCDLYWWKAECSPYQL
jgi:uncharacterized protein RhaS with RHS repeats